MKRGYKSCGPCKLVNAIEKVWWDLARTCFRKKMNESRELIKNLHVEEMITLVSFNCWTSAILLWRTTYQNQRLPLLRESFQWFNLLLTKSLRKFFLKYLSSQLPEERKLDLLKALAEISPYTPPPDSRQILPSVVQLLKVHCLFVQYHI